MDGTFPCPPSTITKDDKEVSNPDQIHWLHQDKLLFGSLIGTLSTDLYPLIYSHDQTSKNLWDTLSDTYAKPSRGHIKQLKDQLNRISKGNRSITD